MSLDFGKLNYAVSLKPLTAFPLDARSYFESYEDAVAAALTAQPAGSSESIYYYGQNVVVVENNKATLYLIQPDNTLVSVGSDVEIDSEELSKINEAVEELKTSLESKADASSVYNKEEVNEALSNKVNSSDVYSKEEINNALDNKVNSSDVYSKEEVNNALNGKVDSSDVYSKEEIDSALLLKVNSDSVYTKEETENKIAQAVAAVDHLERKMATEDEILHFELNPSDALVNTIYMVKVPTATGDAYKEYMLFENNGGLASFEQIGDTSIDLSDYVKTEALSVYATISSMNEALSQKADKTELSVFAKTSEVDSKLAEKANVVDLTALSNKVDTNIGDISALKASVESHTSSITSLQEAVAKKADASELTALAEKVDNDIAALTEFKEATNSSLNSLQELVNTKASLSDLEALNKNKADKTQINALLSGEADKDTGYRLISPSEQEKLSKLTIEDGNLAISGSIEAGSVKGLNEWIANNRNIAGLFSSENENKLAGIAEGAQVNTIESIKLANDSTLAIAADKSVTIPYATDELPGLVKLGSEFKLNNNNQLEINTVDISKITQTEDVYFNCGNAYGTN